MTDEEWEELFDKYITEVVDDEQEHIKSHELPTAIKIRGLVSDLDTQAAANKAAEEGGLPALPEPMFKSVANGGIFARDGYDALQVFKYTRAAIAADRASRQVANKAEVDPVAPTFNYLLRDRLVSVDVSTCDEDAAHRIFAELTGDTASDGTTLIAIETSRNFATPPATTGASTARDQALEEAAAVCDKKYEARAASGHPREASAARNCASEIRALKGSVGASTVLTDERIKALWDETDVISGKPFTVAFARAIEREVAAQAGQVAVPEWISVGERLPNIGEWCNVLLDRELGDYWEKNGKPRYSVYGAQLREIDAEGYAIWQRWQMSDGGPMSPLYLVSHWMPLPAAPSPAKESK